MTKLYVALFACAVFAPMAWITLTEAAQIVS